MELGHFHVHKMCRNSQEPWCTHFQSQISEPRLLDPSASCRKSKMSFLGRNLFGLATGSTKKSKIQAKISSQTVQDFIDRVLLLV